MLDVAGGAGSYLFLVGAGTDDGREEGGLVDGRFVRELAAKDVALDLRAIDSCALGRSLYSALDGVRSLLSFFPNIFPTLPVRGDIIAVLLITEMRRSDNQLANSHVRMLSMFEDTESFFYCECSQSSAMVVQLRWIV